MNDGHQADQDSDNHGYCQSRPYHREVHVNLAGARQTVESDRSQRAQYSGAGQHACQTARNGQ